MLLHLTRLRNLIQSTLTRFISRVFFAVVRFVIVTPVIFYTRVRVRISGTTGTSHTILTPVFFYTRTRGHAHAARHYRLAIVLAVAGLIILTAVIAPLVRPVTAHAASSNTLSFQARLQDSTGAIVANGNYNVEFKLYNGASGGSALWTEDYLNSANQGVKVVNGYLTANLGSIANFPSNLSWDQDLYITMNIGGATPTGAPSWDGEMNPRIHLTAVPYAFQAKSASQLQVSNGSSSSTLGFVAPTNNNTILLPDASGTVCLAASTACGFALASGGTGYTQNGTGVQTNTNFAIQSATTGASTAVIKALAGQTGDLLRFMASDGTTTGGVSPDGQFYSKRGLSVSSSESDQVSLYVNGADDSDVPTIVVKGGANPGAGADLLQFQDASGTVLASVDSSGGVHATSASFSGSVSAGSLLTSNIDAVGSQAINIGSGDTTGINLNKNTTLASGKLLAIASGTGGLTLGSANTFTNNGATVLGSTGICSISDATVSGLLVSTSAVDGCSYLTFAQNTPGITTAIPAPSDHAKGHLLYLTNTGTAVLNVQVNGTTLPVSSHSTLTLLYDGTVWTFAGTSYVGTTDSSNVANTVGALDGSSKSATGATISGNTLYLQSADSSHAGLMNTTDQTFGGNKTFTGTVSVGLAQANGATALCVSGDSNTLSSCSAASTDNYAVRYPIASAAGYGDIVATGSKLVDTYDETNGAADWTKPKGQITQLVKSTTTYQDSTIGIVANNTNAFTLAGNNIKSSDNPMPVALSGRVAVNIAPGTAAIAPGDYITTSTVPGKGMKAFGAGYVIGKALSAWTPDSGETSVMVFVSGGYYAGPSATDYIQNGGNATLMGITVSGTADFSNINASGHATINDLTVMTATVSGNLTVLGLTSVVDLQINGHIITSGSAPTVAAAANAGTAATCSVAGNDTSGQITITTGSTGWDSGAQCELTFTKPFAAAPHPVISPAAGLGAVTDTTTIKPYVSSSPTGFQIYFNSSDTASHTYIFNYFNAQ